MLRSCGGRHRVGFLLTPACTSQVGAASAKLLRPGTTASVLCAAGQVVGWHHRPRGYGVLYRTTPVALVREEEKKKKEEEEGKKEGPGEPELSMRKAAHLMKTGEQLESSGVLVTTRGTIAGHAVVKEVGIIVGSSVKSRHVGLDLWARVRGFFGQSIPAYAEMMVDSSAEATFNLMQEASKRGANAVLRVRYETAASSDPAMWSSTFSYTLAYGTAVVVKPTRRKKRSQAKRKSENADN